MKLSKETLRVYLTIAYEKARKRKKKRSYVKDFEKHLKENLDKLCDELWDRTYKPLSSDCFIINHPKKREVFAAHFRDRIVHHLYFMITNEMFEKTFIHDSYSCIEGKGTHFGVERLKTHILKRSRNYAKECYVLKMDIVGYFMNIDRQLLCNIVKETMHSMLNHRINKDTEVIWKDRIDVDLIEYLTDVIALLDPTVDCIFKSKEYEWNGLPKSKTLFGNEKGKGLPIGNLTSQLFSNIYLNCLDQFAKRVLKCRSYGRYVDDFYVVSEDKNFLLSIIPKFEKFLEKKLKLKIHKGKTKIYNVKHGVPFLGAFIKKGRTYIETRCYKRIKRQLYNMQRKVNHTKSVRFNKNVINSVNSFLGVLSHHKSYNLKKELAKDLIFLHFFGQFNENLSKFIPYPT